MMQKRIPKRSHLHVRNHNLRHRAVRLRLRLYTLRILAQGLHVSTLHDFAKPSRRMQRAWKMCRSWRTESDECFAHDAMLRM